MNFLLVSRQLGNTVTNGMTRYAKNLASGLAAAGHAVTLLSGNADGEEEKSPKTSSDCLTMLRHPLVNQMKFHPERWRQFGELVKVVLKQDHYDAIVIQHPYHVKGTRYARAGSRVPIVYVCHTVAAIDRVLRGAYSQAPLSRANETLEYQALNTSDAVICVSRSVQETIKRCYGIPEDRLHIVPTGIAPAYKNDEKDSASSMVRMLDDIRSTGKRIVLYVGRESYEKGTDLLPRIIQASVEECDAVVFLLVGLNRQSWARYLLCPHTLVLPWMLDDELALVYKMSDVLILPSRRDSMPYVLLEAMSFGVVPVVADTDGPGEVIIQGFNGLKASVNRVAGRIRINTAAMAEAVCLLLKDRELHKRLSSEAQRTIKEHHSMQSQISEFLATVRDL